MIPPEKKSPLRRRKKPTWAQGFAFHCFSSGHKKGSCEGAPCTAHRLNGRLD